MGESTTGGESTASVDGLALLDALAESLLEADTTGELSIVSLVVVDEEEFRASGGGGHLDDFLLGGVRTTVEHVHEGLLLGRRHDDGAAATDGVLGAHEDVVEVDLRVGDVAGRDGLDVLDWGAVQVQVPCHLRSDTLSIVGAHLTISAAISKINSSMDSSTNVSTEAATMADDVTTTKATTEATTMADDITTTKATTEVTTAGDNITTADAWGTVGVADEASLGAFGFLLLGGKGYGQPDADETNDNFIHHEFEKIIDT